MAGLTRKTNFPFAGSSLNTGEFGTAQLGTKILTNDPLVIQGTTGSGSTLAPSTAWNAGWVNAVIGGNNLPPLEEMEGVQVVSSYQISYLLARGIPEYDSGTTYNTGDITRPPASSQLYQSIGNANVGNALPSAVTNGFWTYLGDLANLGNTRTKLTGNTTFYVATTGNDSNPGTSVSPWLTIQHAINILSSNYDLAGFTATISVADGTYTTPISVTSPFTGSGTVQLTGNTGSPSSCIISTTNVDCITVNNAAQLSIGGFKLTTATAGNGFNVSGLGFVQINGAMEFDALAGGGSCHLLARDRGVIYLEANYTISGAAASHFSASDGSEISATSIITVTLTGTPAFATVFAAATILGDLNVAKITFSGSATGVRYSVAVNAVIYTNGGGASFIPGNSAGSFATGGQYV